jgi:hypothetical protein
MSWNGSHPVSFVGLGTHGNYPTENDLPTRQLQCLIRQTPRYLGAAGLFFNPALQARRSTELRVPRRDEFRPGGYRGVSGSRSPWQEVAVPAC